MKKTAFFLIVFTAILFSFSNDPLTEENLILTKAKVPVPLKGIVCMSDNTLRMPVANTPVIDPGTGKVLVPALDLAAFAVLSGHSTHMGILKAGSSMTGVSAELDLSALARHRIVITGEYKGRLTGANGDYIDLVSSIIIDATDPSNRTITGTFTLTGGSGNFENVSGGGVLNGIIPCWNIEGQLEY
jgi:hypothetical protein